MRRSQVGASRGPRQSKRQVANRLTRRRFVDIVHVDVCPCVVCTAQSDVVRGITRSEDELHLMPGNAAGTATPEGIPVCDWSTRNTED